MNGRKNWLKITLKQPAEQAHLRGNASMEHELLSGLFWTEDENSLTTHNGHTLSRAPIKESEKATSAKLYRILQSRD